ncbi:hypothetical protein OG555_05400 [Kribbella sp. NBC_01484]|uniref:hypothetical protein n=1 Tax=Kribbella sp. NBC_01484 TaxID=2903579 RepID=UPI002E3689C8|nr:hypothetical protein [Kribbella sp. NBC_01484]
MAAADRGPVNRLQGGPSDKWQYCEQDFLECIRAAQRMHRRVGDPAGWPLSYERPVSWLVWVWREGRNCHLNPIE